MPILSIYVQVDDDDNVDLMRNQLVAEAERVAQEMEPHAFDADKTVTYDVDDD